MLTIVDAGIVVNVSRSTRAPTQQEFGTLLFLIPDDTVTTENRVVTYTSMSAVAADFDAADAAYKAATAYYAQQPTPVRFKVGRYDPAEDIADELDLMAEKDSGFFCVVADATLRDTADIVAIGQWCLANSRITAYTSNDVTCKTLGNTSNIGYLMKAAGIANAIGFYSATAADYPDCSAFGIFATQSYRGQNSMRALKFKDLPGITIDTLTPNDLAAIKSMNLNAFYEVAGIRMVDDGRTAVTNTWIDEVIITYAVAEEIRVRVFGALARIKTKLPLTEPGVHTAESNVEGALIQFVRNGSFAEGLDENGDVVPAYKISHLPVSEMSAADKAQRICPDLEFEARFAGAIHNVTVSGNLTL